ncbi:MAG TPA: sigma-70 family RNA polymerase sigma factor [Acidobacteriaceae bacterium]|nr:sigma-70 family RNA polymerase sigma factor [Acidobacteriaceae bacterium]
MTDVPKDVATQATALQVPLARREKAREDRELVRQAQKGEGSAFEELVRRHQQKVLGLVNGILRRREDTEDVAQQVFMKAYVSLKKFDQRAAFSTWLYKITVNECWDYLRKKKVRPLTYEADLSEEQVSQMEAPASDESLPQSPEEQAEVKELLEWLLGRLSDEDRRLLVLKEMEGFSVQELAEILNLNVNTVKVRLFRARTRLMDAYRRRKQFTAKRGEAAGAG